MHPRPDLETQARNSHPIDHTMLHNVNNATRHFRKFKFEEGKSEINLTLVENIDIERIYYKGEISSAQSVLKNFIDSKFTAEDIEKMNFEQYSKLFRLS